MSKHFSCFLIVFFLFFHTAFSQKPEISINSNTFGAIEARSIGPAVMGGRIAAIDAVASNPRIIYVGTAGGGIWKSVSGGTTFKPVFDKYIQSVGALAIDQKHPDTVWAGTGESAMRNSVSVGAGLYRTTDGGDSWMLMGLEKCERISKIILHPKSGDTLYVAVPGNLWNADTARGLYKSTDGGKNWNKILYTDENTGCADVAIDPQEPSIVYASMWQFRRTGYSFTSGGKGSALYKSTDGGKNWKKITNGMPEGDLGRITLAVSPSRTSRVYAVIESKKTGLYRSDDLGESWKFMNASMNVTFRPFYFGHLFADPKDYNRVYKPGLNLGVSNDGGKSFSALGGGTHSDHHALWINPENPANILLGTDGGIYVSYDNGTTWRFLNNLPVSQFYHVTYDMEQPYNVYGGLQDNGSWIGPSRSSNGIENRDWTNIGGGDGFNIFPDASNKDVVYWQYQGGNIFRSYRSTDESKEIKPYPKEGEPKFRFNWNAAFTKSPTTNAIYVGAQFLFRSTNQGDSWTKISPDLTTNDPLKQKQEESGGLSIDNSSAENHCTIITIGESPKDQNVIWVGTDDGNIQVTTDAGKTWTNVVKNISGLPPTTWCSCVEPSPIDKATAFATFDGHTQGDKKPYIFKTTDFGKTWTALATDAVKGFAHVIRQDLVNPNLLFVGTEFGLYVSIDGGTQWAQFTGKLSPVPVRDIAIHPREADVILATHGRGIIILDDITPLRSLSADILTAEAGLLPARPTPVSSIGGYQSFPGDGEYVGDNPSDQAIITYYLKDRHVFGDLKLEVFNAEGKLMATLPGGKRKGINRVEWAMRMKPPKVSQGATVAGGALTGPALPEGTYSVKLTKGTKTFSGEVKLVADPKSRHSAADRSVRQEVVMKLYQMQERLAYVSESVKEVRDQARNRAEEFKKGESFAKALEAFATKLDELYKTLVSTREGGRLTGEEQLRERVVDIYGSVVGYGGRPTESQMERMEILAKEIEKANKDYELIIGKELDSINDKLKNKEKNPIKILTKEEFDKRQ